MNSQHTKALRNEPASKHQVTKPANSGSAHLLRLSAGACKNLSEAQIRQELLPLIRSNFYSIDIDQLSVFIDGPDTSYHNLDPYLEMGLRYFGLDPETDNAGLFWSSGDAFDICMEDSWCGRFLAAHLQTAPGDAPLNIIHLDDHTDMMSTLMVSGQPLINPLTDRIFRPTDPADWDDAITSGAIGIGSFLTAFYALNRPVHIMHLRDGVTAFEKYQVLPSVRTHELLEDASFFDIRLNQEADLTGRTQTYSSSSQITDLLKGTNSRRCVVHIDLDYFINDFNGNPVESGYRPDASLQSTAEQKMKVFFDGLQQFDMQIDRWMIATSPGFCSGHHWQFLVENLTTRINQLNSAQPRPCQT